MKRTLSAASLLAGMLLAATFAWGAPPTPSIATASADQPRAVVVGDACVTLIDDVSVPAQEAGVLVSVVARAGTVVKKGQVLAQVDDARARLMVEAAETKLHLAKERAQHTLHVRYAQAAAKVAEAEYERAVEANRKGIVPNNELQRLRLAFERANLQIEQEQIGLRSSRHELMQVEAELEAAKIELQRHAIHAPIDGEIIEVPQRAGEWVNPGDPVCRVVQLDRLWVEGAIDASQVSRGDILRRKVRVEAELPRGRRAELEGKIVFASPIQTSSQYKVRAEVANRVEDGDRLLLPGMQVKMSVDVKPRETER